MSGEQKKFALTADQIQPLLDWEGAKGCIATDEIMVHGRKVGFLEREEPLAGNPDSGWRFFAGDEDAKYLSDASHSGVYALNTLCNYDPDIIPLLHAPVGSAFQRNTKGEFVRVEDK